MNPTPEDILQAKQTAKALRTALATLSPREERVLRLCFGLDCQQQTLKEIATIWSVVPQRVLQIKQKALRKLRHPHPSRGLLLVATAPGYLKCKINTSRYYSERYHVRVCAIRQDEDRAIVSTVDFCTIKQCVDAIPSSLAGICWIEAYDRPAHRGDYYHHANEPFPEDFTKYGI